MNREPFETYLLQKRIQPPAHTHVAERIIAASLRLPQKSPASVALYLQRLFVEFALPRPAYALAALLAVGIMLGVGQPLDAGWSNISGGDDIFYDEGEIL